MDEKKLLALADEFVAKNEKELIKDIAALVSHPSIESEKSGENEPFGKPVRAALDEALKIAERFSLETHDCDGYVGWAELKGSEKEHIATIAHVDVVPAGGGWHADPFTLREKDGWLLGRGVCDDKGPAVLTLYTLKFFKENNIPLRYGLRALIGCSEETGMTDVDYYLERHGEPLFCFSPDSDFPVCYGEKGVYEGEFYSKKISGGKILDFCGGIASNVVPEHAECLVKTDITSLGALPEGISAADENGAVRIIAKGIGGHAAMPEGTKSAILMLVNLLLEKNICSEDEKSFLQMQAQLLKTTDGSGAKINCSDDIFTPLTCIGGIISLTDGVFCQNVNIRYPSTITGAKITAELKSFAAGYSCEYEALSDSAPYHVPKNSPQIKALLSSFEDVFEQKGEPYTMGGGTYSRHFKNACAFGPELPCKLPDFAGPVHGANEGISLNDLLRALKTYILAVWRLQSIDF